MNILPKYIGIPRGTEQIILYTNFFMNVPKNINLENYINVVYTHNFKTNQFILYLID